MRPTTATACILRSGEGNWRRAAQMDFSVMGLCLRPSSTAQRNEKTLVERGSIC